MTVSAKLLQKLKELNYDFFITLPCKFTAEIIELLERDDSIIHVPVTREEEGIGIAAGASLAGRKPCLIFQNSGIGNCINAMESLLKYYDIPVLFLLSHRGTESEKIDAQKPMGKAVPRILSLLGISILIAKSASDIRKLDSINQKKTCAILASMEFWQS